jgi:hypothetical protein
MKKTYIAPAMCVYPIGTAATILTTSNNSINGTQETPQVFDFLQDEIEESGQIG